MFSRELLENIASGGPGEELLFRAQNKYPYKHMEPMNPKLIPGWEPYRDAYKEIGLHPDGTPKLMMIPWTGVIGGGEMFNPDIRPTR
tara:strand:+ start:6212 stop:6472 length:261 start_codon:yes stop_codon:yes gene_type:complete